MHWLTSRKSKLSIEDKLKIYKTIIKPIWTYGIPLWGTEAMSHINKIEKQGHTRDLGISTPKEEISRYAEKYKERIATHPNWLTAEAINI